MWKMEGSAVLWTRAGMLWSKVLGIAGLGPNDSGVQDLMQSPGQSSEGFGLDVGSNSYQSCTRSVFYQLLNLWRRQNGLLGIQAVE